MIDEAWSRLPAIREALQREGLWAQKRFGQHFLLDLNLTRRIAAIAAPLDGKTVIEVGPGPGGLTRALLEAGARRVIAIEQDRRFAPILEEIAAAAPGRLEVVFADALTVDEPALLGPPSPQADIVSNLPYNVGTPLLVKWLKAGPWRGAMTLMFQREVAQRIAAPAGSAAYGRLSVLAQAVTAPRLALTIPARAFTPPPKVASAVVRLDPLASPFPDLDALERVTAAGFGKRRKMLRSGLTALGAAEALLAAAELDPEARAETIPVEGFLRLARAWRAR